MSKTGARKSNKLRRAESTEAVERAACQLFVERGYRSTSIDMIANQVGLTKGAVYFYYKDKQSLLLHLLDQSNSEFSGRVFDALDGDKDDPVGQIDLFLTTIIRAGAELDQHLLLLPVIISMEFKGRGDIVEASVKSIYEDMYTKLADVIQRGQNKGAFSTVLSPRTIASMIVALTDGLLLELYRQSSGVSGKEIGIAARRTINSLLGVTNSAG